MATHRHPSIAGEIRRRLEQRKRALVAEIRGYPQPIAGCDAQYQHLADQRGAVARELARLERAHAAGDDAVRAFIDASTVLDDDTSRRLLAALAGEPSATPA